VEPFLRVLPVFAVILVGLVGKRLGLIPSEFEAPANRLAYYLSVPCLIFLKVADAPFRQVFRPDWIGAALAATLLCWTGSLVLSWALGLAGGSRATFAQAAIHSNLGYIGLAVAYYGLGDRGLQVAGVFAAFFMLLNNTLSVVTLGRYGRASPSPWASVRRVALQPVILASLAGLLSSWFEMPLPTLARETLKILGAMGLPLALLLIGAGLSLETLRRPVPVAAVTVIKNLALPALGALFLTLAGARGVDRAAAVVLLGSPSATLTLVMAGEMGGDVGLAAAAVTVSTLASALTLTLCLALAGP
jgi:predicted permease